MRIAVDSGGYVSAVDEFYQANHGVVDAVEKLSGTLGGSGAMAGDDTGGQAWAEQYDAAAAPLLQAGCQVGEAMAQMANLLNASLSNHEGADYGSRVYGPPMGGATPDDPDPDHWTETLSAADPPSAYGGTGDQPGWWHWIAGHVGGLLWPDADTGQLRSTGDAWRTAGQELSLFSAHVESASGQISLQKSPEVPDAVATCRDLQRHMVDLSDAYTDIGQACADYAQQVDDHHREIEAELASFIEWTIGIEVGGAVLGAVTLGIGEAAAQAAEAAKVAEAATKVVRILQRLIELARLAAVRIGALVAKAGRVTEGLKNLLAARAMRALEKVAPALVKDSRSALLRELEEQGIKHNPAEVVRIFRRPDGTIAFLEKGDARRGLAHVIGEHGPEFAAKGISEKQIPDLIQTALEKGTVVGQQGRKMGRPIYEVMFHGRMVKVAITVGGNGYVVGANLR